MKSRILKICLILTFLLTYFVVTPGIANAACPAGLTNACGTCTPPMDCRQPYSGASFCVCLSPIPDGDSEGSLGSVTNPIPSSSSAPGGGLIILLNNVLRLIFTGAGIYAFIRIIIAGLGFISAGGDVKKITSAWNSIWQSLLGLIIIVSSFAIAALIGQILFGSPGAILNPTIYGPGT